MAYIDCMKENNHIVGALTFIKKDDNTTLPQNYVDYELETIYFYYPYSRYDDVLNILKKGT